MHLFELIDRTLVNRYYLHLELFEHKGNIMSRFVDFFQFIVVLVVRTVFDLLCLVLSPVIFWFYRRICNSSTPNGSREKEFFSIFITGASSGMGKTTAHYFAQESKFKDQNTILHLVGRNVKRLNSVKQECLELSYLDNSTGSSKKSNLKVYTYSMDITNEKGMESILLAADDAKPLDLIFANAGINFGMCQTFEFIESTKELIDVNIKGTLNTIFPIIPRFMKRQSGHIAINASLASYTSRTDCAAYAATKVFLRFICEVLHWGLHNYYNVGVSVVNPGYIRTRMYDATTNSAIKESFRPGSISENEAARLIVQGLKANNQSIDFPFMTFCLAWVIGTAHPFVRTCFGKILVKKHMIDQVFPSPK